MRGRDREDYAVSKKSSARIKLETLQLYGWYMVGIVDQPITKMPRFLGFQRLLVPCSMN